ncbi:MAG: hypothetical protein WCB04_12485 [Mycobacteriales bacterium]
MRAAATIALVLLAVGLVACGTPQSGGTGRGSARSAGSRLVDRPQTYPNACALVNGKDAEKALGEPVAAAGTYDPESDGGGSCIYSAGVEGGDSVSIQVGEAGLERALVRSPTARPVPGLGDEALNNANQLFVRNGDVGMVIAVEKVLGGFPADRDVILVTLARAALQRMKR